jgi:hypothetical protein
MNSLLDSYAAGVNAWVAANPLPPEYAAIEITHFEVPDVRFSDHRPVLCDFNVKRAAAAQIAVA